LRAVSEPGADELPESECCPVEGGVAPADLRTGDLEQLGVRRRLQVASRSLVALADDGCREGARAAGSAGVDRSSASQLGSRVTAGVVFQRYSVPFACRLGGATAYPPWPRTSIPGATRPIEEPT